MGFTTSQTGAFLPLRIYLFPNGTAHLSLCPLQPLLTLQTRGQIVPAPFPVLLQHHQPTTPTTAAQGWVVCKLPGGKQAKNDQRETFTFTTDTRGTAAMLQSQLEPGRQEQHRGERRAFLPVPSRVPHPLLSPFTPRSSPSRADTPNERCFQPPSTIPIPTGVSAALTCCCGLGEEFKPLLYF